MNLRQRQKESTRRRILAAALTCFEADGFDGASVEAIARAAEVSLPTLFRYFPSKADLLFGDDEAVLAGWELAVREVRPGEGLRDALVRATVEGSYRAVDPRLRKLRLRLVPMHEELRRRQLAFDDAAVRRAAEAIRARLGLAQDDLRPQIVAAATMAAVRAAVAAGRAPDDGFAALADALGLVAGPAGRSSHDRRE